MTQERKSLIDELTEMLNRCSVNTELLDKKAQAATVRKFLGQYRKCFKQKPLWRRALSRILGKEI